MVFDYGTSRFAVHDISVFLQTLRQHVLMPQIIQFVDVRVVRQQVLRVVQLRLAAKGRQISLLAGAVFGGAQLLQHVPIVGLERRLRRLLLRQKRLARGELGFEVRFREPGRRLARLMALAVRLGASEVVLLHVQRARSDRLLLDLGAVAVAARLVHDDDVGCLRVRFVAHRILERDERPGRRVVVLLLHEDLGLVASVDGHGGGAALRFGGAGAARFVRGRCAGVADLVRRLAAGTRAAAPGRHVKGDGIVGAPLLRLGLGRSAAASASGCRLAGVLGVPADGARQRVVAGGCARHGLVGGRGALRGRLLLRDDRLGGAERGMRAAAAG